MLEVALGSEHVSRRGCPRLVDTCNCFNPVGGARSDVSGGWAAHAAAGRATEHNGLATAAFASIRQTKNTVVGRAAAVVRDGGVEGGPRGLTKIGKSRSHGSGRGTIFFLPETLMNRTGHQKWTSATCRATFLTKVCAPCLNRMRGECVFGRFERSGIL